MKNQDVQTGKVYLAKVSRSVVRVRVDTIRDYTRRTYRLGDKGTRTTQELVCTNLSTGREIVCTAARLRKEANNQTPNVIEKKKVTQKAWLCLPDRRPEEVEVIRTNGLTTLVNWAGEKEWVPTGDLASDHPSTVSVIAMKAQNATDDEIKNATVAACIQVAIDLAQIGDSIVSATEQPTSFGSTCFHYVTTDGRSREVCLNGNGTVKCVETIEPK